MNSLNSLYLLSRTRRLISEWSEGPGCSLFLKHLISYLKEHASADTGLSPLVTLLEEVQAGRHGSAGLRQCAASVLALVDQLDDTGQAVIRELIEATL